MLSQWFGVGEEITESWLKLGNKYETVEEIYYTPRSRHPIDQSIYKRTWQGNDELIAFNIGDNTVIVPVVSRKTTYIDLISDISEMVDETYVPCKCDDYVLITLEKLGDGLTFTTTGRIITDENELTALGEQINNWYPPLGSLE